MDFKEDMKRLWIKDLKENDNVKGIYLVRKKKQGLKKDHSPFLSFTLADKTGQMDARIWDMVEEYSPLFDEGDIVEIDGTVVRYNNQLQIRVNRISRVDRIPDIGIFLERSEHDPDDMMKELRGLLKSIENMNLKKLLDLFFMDHDFISRFKMAPAAKAFHHAYIAGLLEHTLWICKLAKELTVLYPELDRDLLLCGAFLHDIGKVPELDLQHRIDYTDSGRLMGHIVLGVEMLNEKLSRLKDFPQELAIKLKHLILAHHGEYEFGSPRRPKIPEALALHIIDDLDAKLKGLISFVEKDPQEGSWTEFNRIFERYFLKGAIRSNGVLNERANSSDIEQESLFSFPDNEG